MPAAPDVVAARGLQLGPDGETRRQQVRGGIGVFGGRTPYVWLSNQYGNTGIEFRRLQRRRSTSTNNIPFVPDPDKQPTSVGRATTNEIDVIDPDYDFPQTMRGNLGLRPQPAVRSDRHRRVPVLERRQGHRLQNINLVQTATREDGRPFYRGA